MHDSTCGLCSGGGQGEGASDEGDEEQEEEEREGRGERVEGVKQNKENKRECERGGERRERVGGVIELK